MNRSHEVFVGGKDLVAPSCPSW